MGNEEGAATRDFRYSPLPEDQREGTALCLSGGGFRATLFHLGALRRLNELGVLGKVDVISSVSGGSIVAAHLATAVDPWPEPSERIVDFDKVVAKPLRRFTSRNLRTPAILRRGLPWNWRRRAIENLAKSYQHRLTKKRLGELPPRPKFVLCATDMVFGVNWVFDAGSFDVSRRRVGDYLAGYLTHFPEDWPLAKAIAASSCFPPVFNPMLLRLKPGELMCGDNSKDDRGDLVEGIGLSDGGVYDNLGLEPVWKNARNVLVSDGGAVWEAERDRGLVWRLNRYASVAGRQGGAVRKRWLISSFEKDIMDGTYWGLGSVGAHYRQHDSRCFGETLIDDTLSEVRTDLDAFSQAEQGALENHGYLLADAAARTHLDASLIAPNSPAPQPPHSEWLDDATVRTGLADSHKRKILGRW
jgi:NTE family protein